MVRLWCDDHRGQFPVVGDYGSTKLTGTWRQDGFFNSDQTSFDVDLVVVDSADVQGEVVGIAGAGPAWNPREDIRRPAILAGNFHCELTDDEKNRWYEALCRTELYEERLSLDLEYEQQCRNIGGSDEDNSSLIRRMIISDLECHQFAKGWFEKLRNSEGAKE